MEAFVNNGNSTSPLPTPQDYVGFIGKNADYFIQKFEKFSIVPMAFHASWNWPAFLTSWWWFLYRKMYLWAGLCFVSMCIPYVNFFAWIGWAVAANDLYYKHVQKKISELKSFQGDGYSQHLSTIGGVHSWVPLVAVIVTVIPILLAGACAGIFAVVGMGGR